ncbi:helix-turn-helix transcriptional regulator [Haladaptatus salinisoli]|uniref:helix-turn-helix transcriptional regulator n=1 Tax=Haladaptatus salinisoli TaxID=2884876 RepID=UPI001D0B0516|nr:helix-turn-helix domain-containing protein [Haladaptatus salinisoli]
MLPHYELIPFVDFLDPLESTLNSDYVGNPSWLFLTVGALAGTAMVVWNWSPTSLISPPESDRNPERKETPPLEQELPSADRSSQQNPLEYISDDVRVLQLLVANDEKMYQGEVVQATGWSKSKTSRVLSAMEDEKLIRKTQIGRKNIITIAKRPLQRKT